MTAFKLARPLALPSMVGSMSVSGDVEVASWRSEMTAQTWRVVPAASQLGALDPRYIEAVNPDYSATPEWAPGFGMPAKLFSYSGACYDQTNDVFWAPLQGGHGDYAGNEPYKIGLNVSTPTWAMVRNPSGAVGNVLTTNDGQEATGVYSDGRPRAVHSYNKPVYVPGDGPWLGVTGATSWSSSGGLIAPLRVDPTTGEGTYGAQITTSAPALARTSGGGSTFDPTRGSSGSIWFRVSGTGRAYRYDIAADSWTAGSSLAGGSSVGMCYVESQDLIVILDDNLRLYDPAADTYHLPTVTGSSSGSTLTGLAQPWWVSSLGVFAWWHNSTNRTVISKLTPPAGDWKTGTWTVGEFSVDGSNAVTPTAADTNGTFGRFFYSPNLSGFGLLNAANQDLYFYALD